MDARKWFQVLVVGGSALACPGPVDDAGVRGPVADGVAMERLDAGAGGAPDGGPAPLDAGRACGSRGETDARFEDEPRGVCCIWGGPLHPCCP